MNLSVVIVSWNRQKQLKETLESLKKVEMDFDLYVVDNNSEDNTVEMIENNFDSVNLIDNEVNFGFGRAVNQIIKQIDNQSDFLLVLKPGIVVKKDTLKNFLKFVQEKPQASVVGANVSDHRGERMRSVWKFPRFFSLIKMIFKNNQYSYRKFDYTKDQKVDCVDSGFFGINLKNIQDLKMYLDRTLPKFDNQYFSFFEKFDYCKQIYKSGGEVWYASQIKCIDTSEKKPLSKIQKKYFKDSMIKYVSIWHHKLIGFILKILFIIKK